MKEIIPWSGLIWIFCIFDHVICEKENTTCMSKGPEACVYEHIFRGYNKLVRPTDTYNKVIDVYLQLVLNGLLDIEEKDEFMRVVGFFRAIWYDDLLRWDPGEHDNVSEIVVPAQEIWTPDIGITNSVTRFYEITYKRDFHLKIQHSGRIRWSFGGILTTSCDIDLTYYPFDEQECDIEVESWQYELDKVKLHTFEDVPVNLDTLGDDPQWILNNATGDTYFKYDGQYSTVKFSLHWTRKPLYFYINIILPSAYMAIITLGVFWLPIECGEKMSLGITVVLAFSVFQIVIMDITPVSSDAVPKITELVVTVMSLATVSLLSSMVVSYLNDHSKPPPRWVKVVFLGYLPRVLRMSYYELYKEEIFGNKSITHLKDRDVYRKHFVDDERVSPRRSVSPTATEINESVMKPQKQGYKDNTATSQNAPSKVDNHTPKPKRHNSKHNSRGTKTQEEASLARNVKEILVQLEHMKWKISEEEHNQKIKEDWKYIGRTVDRLVFWLCLIVLIFYILYAYFKVTYGH